MEALNNSRILRTIPLLIAVCLIGLPAEAKYGGGSGTAEDPYQIATAADLILLGDSPGDYDKHFILTTDIDLDPNLPGRKVFDKAVIAPNWDTPFTGVLDGNGHTIPHLTITGGSYLGLFGRLESGAEVKDLGVVDVNIAASGSYVGGLVGFNFGGTVIQCYGTGVVGGGSCVGGLAGENWSGSVTDCYATGAVSGDYAVGGLVGYNCYASITTSHSTGAASGKDYVGGLVGENYGGTVTDCYSTGTVTGKTYVGGLVGFNDEWAIIATSYSSGSVSGTESVGGLVGYNWWGLTSGSIGSSFWDIQTSGQTKSAGGTGKTTAEMQTAKTFLDAGLPAGAGWDFVNVWGIGENQTYPYLRQYSAAEINQDGSVNFLDLAVLSENWLTGIAP